MLRHNDNLENKEKVRYDLYKILRMSILLNQNEVDILTLDKFKEASLSIDKMLGEVYDEKLETMFYETTTLENEEKRLKDLVELITNRIEKRKSLLEDYRSVTNKELNGLEYIDKSNELDLYESRLKKIKTYLDNSKLIEVNEQDLEVLKEQLVKEFDLKSSNELKNTKLEETLYNTFVNSLYEMDLYASLESTNIEKEIETIQKEIKETKEQKDTFEQAFNNLKISGISGELELEYASYVENSKRNYYYVKEKEIILKLYNLLEVRENEYSDLFTKRENVKELLQERILLRKELGIKDKDQLLSVFDLVEEQDQEIESQKENIDNINMLSERIKLKENRLEELNKEIKKPEILSILKEYSLIDTYEVEDDSLDIYEEDELSLEEEQEKVEENKESALNLLKELLPEEDFSETESVLPEEEEFNIIEETPVEPEAPKEYLPNQIKDSSMVPTMNFGLSRLKSISVMKRVGDMLGINAKSIEKPVEAPKEEPKVSETSPIFEPTKTIESIFEDKKDTEDLFWTPNEFVEMKADTENTNEIFPNEQATNKPVESLDNQIFEFKMPEATESNNESQIFETPIDNQIFENQNDNQIFEVQNDSQIFENQSSNNGLIFPEPVMPDFGQNILPENNEDKFVWPENAENFDINGIFPN